MSVLSDYSERSEALKQKVAEAFAEAGMKLSLKSGSSERIKLVFAGQYSAGKSSVLRMLTGREDIEVGEGITTQQANTYLWKGIEVIDTPGIHTTLRPDHDEISYKAIAAADMLVFVITNELFDPHIAEHFRKLAIDRDKAGEMILVVNKMERADGGNSPEQQEIIREDLRKVLEPYTPEQLCLSFLDAESYLNSLDESDPEITEELISRSGYAEFVKNLDSFVRSRNIVSKLTTELYIIDEQLEKAVHSLEPGSDDPDIDALEENYLQQRHIFTESRSRMRQEVSGIYSSAASRIRELGLEAANLIVEGCVQENVERELEKAVCSADDIIEKCQSQAADAVNNGFSEIGADLRMIENSEFAKRLKANLNSKFDRLPDGVRNILQKAGPGLQKAGQKVLGNAYKAGANGGLTLTNFSGSAVHQAVLKVGHTIGYKFKPWQAIKITRGIAAGGQVLSVFGVGLSVFMQIKSDHDDDRLLNELRTNRQNIRSQFNTAADELEAHSREYITESISKPLELYINDIDENLQQIRDSRENRSQLCRKLELIQSDCRRLIRDIHSSSD